MYTIIFMDNGRKIFKCNSNNVKEVITKIQNFVFNKYIQRCK